jgi:hypothetical protein
LARSPITPLAQRGDRAFHKQGRPRQHGPDGTQHLLIARVYEKAAADKLGVLRQQRAAFARKAEWFRLLARTKAKKDATVTTGPQAKLPEEPSQQDGRAGEGWTHQTVEERLKKARAAVSVA